MGPRDVANVRSIHPSPDPSLFVASLFVASLSPPAFCHPPLATRLF
jgi:hypothetical protein